MRVPPAQPQRTTIRPYLSTFCALLLLASSGSAFATSGQRNPPVHDWSFRLGEYWFGLVQWDPGSTHLWYGPGYLVVEGYDAPALAAGFAAVVGLVGVVVWQFNRRHRPPVPPPEP